MAIIPPAARHIVIAMTVLVVAVTLPFTRIATAETYLLGPQDKVRLKVYEWRASRDVIFEWGALNDVFIIGADGTLALPFAGVVEAQDLTPEALAGTIAQRLVRQMRLGHAPDVAVEIVGFRPFYIVGEVANPGEYAYRPELGVLQAIGIAGGVKTRFEGDARLEREVIAGRGDVSLLELSNIALLARRARLRAELEGSAEIVFHSDLSDRRDGGVATVMMQQEKVIFEARREGMAAQLRSLEELSGFLDRETQSLEKQVGFLDQQIESVKEELASITRLVDQGLTVAQRQVAIERTLLQVQSDRLTAETALLRARQEASRTDIRILELRHIHATDVASALRDIETQLSEVHRRTDTALLLLRETGAAERRQLEIAADSLTREPVYTILRQGKAGAIELPATETSRVNPGDVIKVAFPQLGEVEPSDTAASEDLAEFPLPASAIAN